MGSSTQKVKWSGLITIFIDRISMDSPVYLVWSAFPWFVAAQDAVIPKINRKVLEGIFVFDLFRKKECAKRAVNALHVSSLKRRKNA